MKLEQMEGCQGTAIEPSIFFLGQDEEEKKELENTVFIIEFSYAQTQTSLLMHKCVYEYNTS